MIKETTVRVNITNRNKKRYTELGYDTETKEIDVNIDDLNKNSRIKVTAICKLCNSENVITYNKYIENYNRHNFYSCKSCSRHKAKLTNNEIYGADAIMQTDIGKEKYRNTCLKKYGVENVLLDKRIQKKKNNTMIERYGSKCPLINEKVKEKSIKTNLEKYGAETYNKSIFFKKKIHKKYNICKTLLHYDYSLLHHIF